MQIQGLQFSRYFRNNWGFGWNQERCRRTFLWSITLRSLRRTETSSSALVRGAGGLGEDEGDFFGSGVDAGDGDGFGSKTRRCSAGSLAVRNGDALRLQILPSRDRVVGLVEERELIFPVRNFLRAGIFPLVGFC